MNASTGELLASSAAPQPFGDSRVSTHWLDDPSFHRAIRLMVALAFLLPWIVLFITIPPIDQEFPLNDDWAFSKGLFALLDGKGINYQGWSSMPLLGQWLWATPFVLLFGKSQVALRLSTLCLSALGLTAFYDLVRREGVSPAVAAFGVMALAWSPYFFILSGTFMTDVPSLCASLIALALYARALASGNRGLLLAGASVAVLAALTRQNTIVAPLAALLLLAMRPQLRRRPLWWLGMLVPVAVCLGAHWWLMRRMDTVPRPLHPARWPHLALFPFTLIHFLGVFAIPALALAPGRGSRKVFLVALFVLSATAVGIYIAIAECGLAFNLASGAPLPALAPYLDVWLPEAQFIQAYEPPLWSSDAVRLIVTIAGCVGGAGVVARVVELVRQRYRPGPLLLFTLLQLPILLASPILYDRYMFFLIPGTLLIALLDARFAPPRWRLALPVLCIFGVLSLGVMHDWLSLNAARWKLGRCLVNRGVAAHVIEGGLEWDGWWATGPSKWADINREAKPVRVRTRGLAFQFTQMIFPDLVGAYAIGAARPMLGDAVIAVDRESYRAWLPPGHRTLYVVTPRPAAPAPQKTTPAAPR